MNPELLRENEDPIVKQVRALSDNDLSEEIERLNNQIIISKRSSADDAEELEPLLEAHRQEATRRGLSH